MKIIQACLVATALALTLVASAAAQPEDEKQAKKSGRQAVEFEQSEQGVWFREGERPILFYQAKPKSRDGSHTRANYIHPLYDLRGKQVLTEDFPDDHRHHRGVFWTWHQTLVNGKQMGDAWTTQRFAWNVVDLSVARIDGGAAQLNAKVEWTSPDFGSDKPFAREQLKLTVFSKRNKARLIDFQIQIASLVDDLQLGGSNDVKGYGGFSVRVACPPDLKFVGGAGPLTPQTTAVEGGDWLNISGAFGARTSNVTVLTDTRAPGKHDWILRSKRSMQNPRFPGREPIRIQPEKPLQLHYGLIVHQRKDLEHIGDWRDRFLALLVPASTKTNQAKTPESKSP